MSLGEELRIFGVRFVEGLQRPLFPIKTGILDHPVWLAWGLAGVIYLGFYIQRPDPRKLTTQQRIARVIYSMIPLFIFFYGLSRVLSFAIGG